MVAVAVSVLVGRVVRVCCNANCNRQSPAKGKIRTENRTNTLY